MSKTIFPLGSLPNQCPCFKSNSEEAYNNNSTMTREEILKSPEYHLAGLQVSVYNMLEREKSIKNLTNLQLAKQLNISVARVRQILDGDYDGKVSQLIEIALKLGYIPEFKFYHPIFTKNINK